MIISITHEIDLDGLGSQAIIKRYFTYFKNTKSDDILCYYAHYINFKEVVQEVLSKITPEGLLIISDIGFNEDFMELFPLFEKCKEKNCRIYWFDHHIVDKEIQRVLKNTLEEYINDPIRCTAEIIKDYYLPHDSIAIKIASFSRDTDFKTKKYAIASKIQSIISFNRGNELKKNKEKIVSLMADGIFENEWYEKQLIKIRVWEEEQTQFAINHAKLIKIEEFGKFIISFAKLSGGKVVSILKDYYPKAKFFIGIDIRYNEITIHSDYVDCRELARNFKGGGHKNRAGFKYEKIFTKNYEYNQEFIRNIKKSINQFKINKT